MKAVVCSEFGMADKLTLDANWAEPEVGENEILIDVKAAGLNFPDVLMIQGKYQSQPPMPFIPGGELAGIVSAVGDKVTRYKVGDKVIASTGVNAFCERVAVHEMGAFPMPESLSFEQAAGVCVTYFTTYHAYKQRAQLKEGDTVLVLGAAGGVGTTAVELGKLMGAKVVACASSDEKLEICKKLGADEVINYTDIDLKATLKEVSGGKGFDVIYDPVGGDYAEPAIRNLAWNGRYLVIGFASGPIPKIPLNLALLKGASIVGVFWGRFMGEEPEVNMQNIKELWELFDTGKLSPIVTDCYSLDQYEDAFNCMIDRRARGKVIITP